MTHIVDRQSSAIPTSAPSTSRLRLGPTGARRTLLDGGWWPRSTDPVAELPGLVLAIDALRGPVTRLVLSTDGWDVHPRRLDVAGRVLRLSYFTSQPAALLTALCGDTGERVDLLVVAPEAEARAADAAMMLAATASNLVHAQDIFAAATHSHVPDNGSDEVVETDGGRPRSTNDNGNSPGRPAPRPSGVAATPT
jgi:hypothetical protein